MKSLILIAGLALGFGVHADPEYYESAESYADAFMSMNCKKFSGNLISEDLLDGDEGYSLTLFTYDKGWIEVTAQPADPETISESDGFITESYSTNAYSCTKPRP